MIITFYSFKGGVGRSMALANVAVLLARAGFRVLVVDADLEAPGLESYLAFPDAACQPNELKSGHDAAIDRLKKKNGFIDLICDYRQRVDPDQGQQPWPEDLDAFPKLTDYISQLDGRDLDGRKPGTLQVITAGNRSNIADYARRVNSFDWNSFTQYAAGDAFFERFRRELNAAADFVFIDSRTGVTEMGGVCTRNLADLVVAVCAPNDQNLEGTRRVVGQFLRPELQKQREGIARSFHLPDETPDPSIQRPLDVFVLPSRVDQFTAGSLYAEFARRLETVIVEDNQDVVATGRPDLPELKVLIGCPVPYIPYRAFRERLAVPPPPGYRLTSYAYDPDPMTRAYQDLTDEILGWGIRRARLEENETNVPPIDFVIAAAPEDLEWAQLLREGLESWNGGRVSVGLHSASPAGLLSHRLRAVFGDPTLPPPLIILMNPEMDLTLPRWGTADVGQRYANTDVMKETRVVQVDIGHSSKLPGRLTWKSPHALPEIVEEIHKRFGGAPVRTLDSVQPVDAEKQRKKDEDKNLRGESAIRARLDEVKKSLDWENTTGSARKWWSAFEEENKSRLPQILELARELESRKANITEFFLAYVYSNTDNIPANLAYLDYTRLKKEEERKKKEAAIRALQNSAAGSRSTRSSEPTP